LEELIEEAKKLTDYQELAQKLKQINDFYGQRIYEEKEAEINALKKKLAELNPEQYSQTNKEMIGNELNKNNLNTSDLDATAQAALNKLKDGTEKDAAEIDKLKKTVSDSIGTKVALNKLDKLLAEYEKIPDTEPERKKAAKKKIIEFYSQISSDLFHKNVPGCQSRSRLGPHAPPGWQSLRFRADGPACRVLQKCAHGCCPRRLSRWLA